MLANDRKENSFVRQLRLGSQMNCIFSELDREYLLSDLFSSMANLMPLMRANNNSVSLL